MKAKEIFKGLLSLAVLWGISIVIIKAAIRQGGVGVYFWSFCIAFAIYAGHEIGKQNKKP